MKRILNILFPATGIVLMVFLSALLMPGTMEKLAPSGGEISNWWLLLFAVAIFALFLAIDLSNRVKVYADYKHSSEGEEFWNKSFPMARMRVMRTYLMLTLIAAMTVLVLVFWIGGKDAVKPGEQAAWIWWAIKILSIVIGFGVIFMFNAVTALNQGERLILGSAEKAPDIQRKAAFWGRIFQIKPTSTDKDTDLGEDFDGISELDNPPPPWFMYMFYTTILVAIIYFVRFLASPETPLRQETEYVAEMKQAEAARKLMLANAAENVDETSAKLVTDAARLAPMKEVFTKRCVVCHGQKAEGLIGPNLTDEYWVYGADVKNLFKIIKNGTTNGMQAFNTVLKPSEIETMASYVLSLQGTNAGNPAAKAPQGEKTAAPAQSDSSAVAPAPAP
jgi:cytochrome c oxidase cbb3-type subunit 3